MVYDYQNEVTMKPVFIDFTIIISNFAIDKSMQKPMGGMIIHRLLVACLLLLLPTVAGAYDFMVDGIYYSLVDGYAVVTNNGQSGCYSGEVVIPEAVTNNGTTYPVTAIGKNAFMICTNLTHVTLPNTVTSVGDNAFAKCTNLAGIDLPDSLKEIGQYAFTMCDKLTSVTIPDSVTSINQFAFYACTALETLRVGKSVTNIGENAFAVCLQLTTLIWNAQRCYSTGTMMTWNIDSVAIGDEVEVIPDHFLMNSRVASIVLPRSVTTIGDYAFEGCDKLASILIGRGVTNIGHLIFKGCSQLTEVISLANTPPDIGDGGLFDNTDYYAHTTLHVLPESLQLYQSANHWKDFYQIFGDVSLYNPGDVNGDGEINIADANSVVVIIINGGSNGHTHILSLDGKSLIYILDGDVNGDGEINIADVNAIIDIILNNQANGNLTY